MMAGCFGLAEAFFGRVGVFRLFAVTPQRCGLPPCILRTLPKLFHFVPDRRLESEFAGHFQQRLTEASNAERRDPKGIRCKDG